MKTKKNRFFQNTKIADGFWKSKCWVWLATLLFWSVISASKGDTDQRIQIAAKIDVNQTFKSIAFKMCRMQKCNESFNCGHCLSSSVFITYSSTRKCAAYASQYLVVWIWKAKHDKFDYESIFGCWKWSCNQNLPICLNLICLTPRDTSDRQKKWHGQPCPHLWFSKWCASFLLLFGDFWKTIFLPQHLLMTWYTQKISLIHLENMRWLPKLHCWTLATVT